MGGGGRGKGCRKARTPLPLHPLYQTMWTIYSKKSGSFDVHTDLFPHEIILDTWNSFRNEHTTNFKTIAALNMQAPQSSVKIVCCTCIFLMILLTRSYIPHILAATVLWSIWGAKKAMSTCFLVQCTYVGWMWLPRSATRILTSCSLVCNKWTWTLT